MNEGNYNEIMALLNEMRDDLKSTKATLDQVVGELKLRDEKIECLEGQLVAQAKIIEDLQVKCDSVEQYGKRLNLRINGIPVPEDGKETEAECLQKVKTLIETNKDIEIPDHAYDRVHRVGLPKVVKGKAEHQMIVRFTSWRYRSAVYKNRKNFEDAKVFLDITKRRYALKQKAIDKVGADPRVDFICIDSNCNLSIRLKSGKFLHFATEDELDSLDLDK